MLPVSARLRKEQDVQRVRRFGRPARGTYLSIRSLQSKVAGPRCTVVVSKRVDKRATVRNKLKRQVRARIIGLYPRLRQNNDMVVSVQPAARGHDSVELDRELTFLLERLHLFTS